MSGVSDWRGPGAVGDSEGGQRSLISAGEAAVHTGRGPLRREIVDLEVLFEAGLGGRVGAEDLGSRRPEVDVSFAPVGEARQPVGLVRGGDADDVFDRA